jgi:peptidoglycan/xylan/chitin deacetylase (PgdA/CDA1 family)
MNNSISTYMEIRSLLRHITLDILGTFATPAPGIHILNGHRIENEKEPETFKNMLIEMSRYVSFINIEDAVRMIVNREKVSKPLVAFTFDDGFMDCYNIFAPVLEEFGVNAMFFINPNYVDGDVNYIDNFDNHIVMTPGKRPMRWEQLKALSARGHVIAAHTMDHYMINSNDENTLRYQIESCKEIIESNIGKPCDYFAFPYGKLSQVNQKSINIACEKYKYVFSQSDYKHYFSFNNKVINRRHFEAFWPVKHVFYFISCHKTY